MPASGCRLRSARPFSVWECDCLPPLSSLHVMCLRIVWPPLSSLHVKYFRNERHQCIERRKLHRKITIVIINYEVTVVALL
jgi:hypothetical protein